MCAFRAVPGSEVQLKQLKQNRLRGGGGDDIYYLFYMFAALLPQLFPLIALCIVYIWL